MIIKHEYDLYKIQLVKGHIEDYFNGRVEFSKILRKRLIAGYSFSIMKRGDMQCALHCAQLTLFFGLIK